MHLLAIRISLAPIACGDNLPTDSSNRPPPWWPRPR